MADTRCLVVVAFGGVGVSVLVTRWRETLDFLDSDALMTGIVDEEVLVGEGDVSCGVTDGGSDFVCVILA